MLINHSKEEYFQHCSFSQKFLVDKVKKLCKNKDNVRQWGISQPLGPISAVLSAANEPYLKTRSAVSKLALSNCIYE